VILVIDNYDSFVYNLARYVRELGDEAVVRRNDQMTLGDIEALAPSHIIISPGPCSPAEAGISNDVVRHFGPAVPILAFIPESSVRRGTELLWGVQALPAEPPADTDGMISLMDLGLLEHGHAAQGDHVVMAAASPAGRTTTNMVKVHIVGSPVR